MPKLMKDLQINEVSGVDRAANLADGWLMMKDATPETAALLAQAELLAKGITSNPVERTAPMPFDKEALAKAFPEAATLIETLEKEKGDAEAALAVAKSATAPTPTVLPTEAELFAKSLESLPEPVRKAIAETQRQASEATEALRVEKARRERDEFTSVAKSLTHVPGVTEAFGETMQKALHGDALALADVFKALTTANAALKESALFKEIGSNAPAVGSAEDQLTSLAKSFMAADSNLTEAEAITKAATSNPDLYARHLTEGK